MTLKITLTEEQISLLKTNSIIVHNTTNKLFLPYWFETTEDPTQFIAHMIDYIPEELINSIKIKSQSDASQKN